MVQVESKIRKVKEIESIAMVFSEFFICITVKEIQTLKRKKRYEMRFETMNLLRDATVPELTGDFGFLPNVYASRLPIHVNFVGPPGFVLVNPRRRLVLGFLGARLLGIRLFGAL